MVDASLLCQLLESNPRVAHVRDEQIGDTWIAVFDGCHGTVRIDMDDDTFCEDLGKIYLTQLGLADLIPAIFPPQPVILGDDEEDQSETS